MKLIITQSFILCICILSISTTSVYSEDGLSTNRIDVVKEVNYTFRFDTSDHVANGIMLRNRTSGTILLRGVPADAQVVKGLLYYNFIDKFQYPDTTVHILFDGNLVCANHRADSDQPCWDSTFIKCHSYYADVTPYIITQAHPNQDYSVVLPFYHDINTSGENPWETEEPGDRLLEGATLIVVYHTPESNGPVFIYDALNESMFSSSGEFTLFHPGIQDREAFLTLIGADGQRGRGHDNIVSNERSYFNGNEIAGPHDPVVATTSVDWDGSDGWPLIQLWDTHTHIVHIKEETSCVYYRAYNDECFDCVVPVAFVIDVK